MWPVLFELGPIPISGYATFLALACLVTYQVRRVELNRLGYARQPGFQWVGVGALLGAVVGSKLGMWLFLPPMEMEALWHHLLEWDFTGKTVVGGIGGGYIGVEVAKRLVGITSSTGDAWAVALPLGQAIGRIGCLLAGCCYGAPSELPWALPLGGVGRHPVQLYEALLDLTLAGVLWHIRLEPRPSGHLFRRYLVGYSVIRLVMEEFRGEPVPQLGPLSYVQVACVLTVLVFGVLIWRGEAAGRSASNGASA